MFFFVSNLKYSLCVHVKSFVLHFLKTETLTSSTFNQGKFTQIYNILGQLTRTIQIFFLLLAFFKYQAFFLHYEKKIFTRMPLLFAAT